MLLQIRKQSGTNTVEVANNLKARLATLEQALLPGYQLRIVRDEADFIEASIDTVEEHLVVGSLLAAFVVLLFLGNLRSTIIAAISIPTSIIATFALIWYMGFTLNMLTMLALTLSVGIVIDDAIVVLENIYRFIEEKGMPPMQAAIEATREIGLAVMATTFSLVAIFAPVGFMSGMVGRFMQSFGLTMAFAVLVSLFVSFTLTPMMSAYWLKVKPRPRRTRDARLEAHDALRAARSDVHAAARVGDGASRRRRGRRRSSSCCPASRSSGSSTSTSRRWTISRSSTSPCARPKDRAWPRPRFSPIASRPRSGRSPRWTTRWSPSRATRPARSIRASVFVRLKPLDERRARPGRGHGRGPQRRAAAGGQGRRARRGAGVGRAGWRRRRHSVRPAGPDLDDLERYSKALREKVAAIPGLVDVDTTLNLGKPELSVHIDRPKAADLGVSIGDAAEALRLLVGGDAVTTFNDGGEQYEVHLRAREEDRTTEQAIAALSVPSSRLGSVSLDNIATFERDAAPATISRIARQRQVTIVANMLPGTSQAAVQQQIADRGAELEHGPRISRRLHRPIARAQSHGDGVSLGDPAVAGVHVSDSRGAVRVVAAPGDDSAVAAADAAVRADLDRRSSASR